jgi:ABC-2 type transport system permease protein
VITPSQVVLVAEREVREQLRGKPVWISTAITLVGVVLAIVLPHVFASGTTTYDVAVVGQADTSVRGAITQAARNAGARADIHVVPDATAAKAALRAGGSRHADIALDPTGTGRVIVDRAITPGSTDRRALVAEGIARTVAVAKAIVTSGVTQAQARALLDPQPLALDHLRPAPASSAHRGLAVGSSIVFFVLVIGFGTAVLTGVVHEKSTRVVEVILSSMRPVNLLAGKVAGASLIVIAQGALLVAAALLAAKAVGSDILAGSGLGAIVASGVWIVLGFVLYAWLFAALGSLASRVEDAQSIAFPMQIPLFVGYFASFSAIGASAPNTLVTVLAYVPFTAPMDMSVLTATGAVAWWQVAVSMLITLATIVLAARVAATVFQRSILRIGQRVRLRTVLGRDAAAARS